MHTVHGASKKQFLIVIFDSSNFVLGTIEKITKKIIKNMI